MLFFHKYAYHISVIKTGTLQNNEPYQINVVQGDTKKRSSPKLE